MRGTRLAAGLIAACVSMLLLGSAASAADFTWSGDGTDTSGPWSNGANWVGNAAPAPNASIGTLTFPQLDGACAPPPSASLACTTAHNDVSGLSVDQLVLDDGVTSYKLTGDGIQLGGGGLTASSASPDEGSTDTLLLPIALTASQTWNVATGLVAVEGLSGSSADLSLSLGNDGEVDLYGDNEVGDATASAADDLSGVLGLIGNIPNPARLNAVDGRSVTLDGTLLVTSTAQVGPLVGSGAMIDVGEPFGTDAPGTLAAASLTLDNASDLSFRIAGSGTSVGSDYAQLTSTGAVSLGGALLDVASISPSFNCLRLPVGQQYTLISTTGPLTGAFANAPDGGTVTDDFGCSDGYTNAYRIDYHESGPVQTVTATVVTPVGLSPSTVTPPQITGAAPVGSVLSASTGSWSGDAPLAYAYQWLSDGVPIPGATGSSWTVLAGDQGHALSVRVTATNANGSATATSAGVSVPAAPVPPPPPPPVSRLSIGKVSVYAGTVTVALRCGAGAGCAHVSGVLRAVERLRGRSVVGVAAAKRKTRTRSVVVGGAATHLAAGGTATLTLRLNRTGRALLRRFGRLGCSLGLSTDGKSAGSRHVRFAQRTRARRP